MNEYNFTHEELIRLFDSASPQTQRMVFAILKIDHEGNANNREHEQYLGNPKSRECTIGYDSVIALINGFERLEPATPKWISVEEKLPENDGEYLVVRKFNFLDNVYRNVTFVPFDTDVGFYYEIEQCDDSYRRERDDEVTHWMPLPEPPKEDARGT